MSHFTTSLNIMFYMACLCSHVTGTSQMSGCHINTGINDDGAENIFSLLVDTVCFIQTASLQ